MSGRLREWADRHPTTVKRLVLSILFGLVVYAVLAGLSTKLVEINRDGCERGNASRVAEKNVLNGEKSSAETKMAIAIQKQEPAYVFAYREERHHAEKGIEELVSVAQNTPYATSPGSVTISCAEASPPPLPWFGER